MTDKASIDRAIAAQAPLSKLAPDALTPMAMLQIAVERGADMAQLEKLMDLQERWEARQAKSAFVRALSLFKAAPPTVVKTKAANFGHGKTTYKFATLAMVTDVIAPALSEHGLSHRWSVEQSDAGLVSVTCVLTHEAGHSESATLRGAPDASGSKNVIQAIGSTVSYLERYTLLAVTGLAASDIGADDDDGGGGPELISVAQKDELVALSREVGANTEIFLAFLGVPSLDLLPLGSFDHAVASLEKKRRMVAP